MQDLEFSARAAEQSKPGLPEDTRNPEVVSTHVLVPEEQVLKLRELSRRTRVAQSEYLREAVEDLLLKYGRQGKEEP